MIRFWKQGLGEEDVEELMIVSIAKIEDYKKMLRESRMAAGDVGVNVGVAAWLVGSWGE